MSDPQVSSPSATWNLLAPDHRRVLGVLIEKQKTSKSADAYPMTLNGITTGCNQKSNRDPVTDYDEDDVEETLDALQKSGHVMKMTGTRVDRWRHLLYELWKVTKVEMAILAELLLRGAQTEGDLRARASRMDEIADLEELRSLLKGLSERKLVIYLSEPGRRGTMLTHGFHTAAELERLRQAATSSVMAEVETGSPRAATVATPGLAARIEEAFAEIAKLREQVARLEQRITEL